MVRDARYKSFFTEAQGLERLYDLHEDPDETRDLVAEDDLAEVRQRHRAWFADYARTVAVCASDEDLRGDGRAAGNCTGRSRMATVRRWYRAVAAEAPR